ncbi:hypothetical protein Tco_1313033 [Tanacetum coccineum]
MACALPHTDSEVEALVQRLINKDKGRQDVMLNLAFQFEDSCAANCPLTEKELHQLRMDEEAQRNDGKEAHAQKGHKKEKISKNKPENDAILFRIGYLAVTSSGLSSDVSDDGLPSEKVMKSRRNDDDGDLLLFRDAPNAGAVIGLPERLASQVFLDWNVPWRLPIPKSCQAQHRLLWPRSFAAHGHGKAAAYGGCRDISSASQVWHAHVYTDHAWVIPCVSCLNHARPRIVPDNEDSRLVGFGSSSLDL